MLPVEQLLHDPLVVDFVPGRILFARMPYTLLVVFLRRSKAGHMTFLLDLVFGCGVGLLGMRVGGLIDAS